MLSVFKAEEPDFIQANQFINIGVLMFAKSYTVGSITELNNDWGLHGVIRLFLVVHSLLQCLVQFRYYL